MKFIFIYFSLALFILASCKKTNNLKTINPAPSDTTINNVDLGIYTITEAGSAVSPIVEYKYLTGYTDKFSYSPGDSITYYLTSSTPGQKTIAIKDANNKTAFTISAMINTQQIKNKKPWVDGFGYDKTLSATIPQNLKSGVYFIDGRIPFVCKNINKSTDITIVYPSNTTNAYNNEGGKCLYSPTHNDRSTVVSFLRTRINADPFSVGFLKWFINTTYNVNVNYVCDKDLDNFDEIQNSKVVILIGHSEYWTRKARENIDHFVDLGKNVLVISGNTMWWQVRYNEKKNLMICYKSSALDPLGNTPYSTDLWSTPSLNYSSLKSVGASFTYGGFGNKAPSLMAYKIVDAQSPLLKGTQLNNGDFLAMPTYEYDGSPITNKVLPGSTDTPVLNNQLLNFYKLDLIGYDFASTGFGMFIVFQKTKNSGIVVNGGSEDWCANNGIEGKERIKIQTITKNMIEMSLNGGDFFNGK
jgi:hypothetical protein